jgi:hypothetical protein
MSRRRLEPSAVLGPGTVDDGPRRLGDRKLVAWQLLRATTVSVLACVDVLANRGLA